MKKCMFIIFSMFLFFQGLTSLHASGTLDLSEVGNGKINTTISTTDGYVSGFDLSIKVSGNVKFDNVLWNSSFNNYDTRVTYKDNIIHLVLTTGKQVNLLDVDGKLNLGVLVFSSNENKDVDYELELSSLTIIDGTYKSKEISSLNTNNNSYQMRYEEENIPSENNPGNEDNVSSESNPSNQGSVTGNTNYNENSNVTNEENTENSSEEEKEETSKIEDNKTNEEATKDEVVEEDNKKSGSNILKIVIPILFIMIIISFVIYVRKSNEQERKQGF